MLTQEFVSTICGPPLAANTAISKDVGIYSHSLTPSHPSRHLSRRALPLSTV
ncbi:Pre-rRNA-processing protein ipi3 [Fusarium oxysporum]|nr:Pre-rRNA-processing protein ipi3 [Fusarium oxysporum]